MAVVINIDGSKSTVDTIEMPIEERLELFQSIIGGYLETVPVKGGGYLLFHEAGKQLNLLQNTAATELVNDFLMSDDYIAGTAIHASMDELDGEAPVNPTRLSPSKDGVVILVVDREREVEAGFVTAAVERLRSLSADKESAIAYEGTLQFVVDGYDDDPRELREIPEVRVWFANLTKEWGYWSWFLSKQDESVGRLFAILLAGESAGTNEVGEEGGRVEAREITALMLAMFAAQNRLVEDFHIDESINKRVSEEFSEAVVLALG